MAKNNNKDNRNNNRNKNNNNNRNNNPNRNKPRPKLNAPKNLPKKNPLLEPNHPLAGKELQTAANELVKGQIRPALNQYGAQLGNLDQEEGRVNSQEKAILGRVGEEGQQGGNNIKSYYDQLAAQETAFLNAQQGSASQLQQFLTGNTDQAQAGVAGATTAAQQTAGTSPTGQPIAAQERLTQMGQEYGSQVAKLGQVGNQVAAGNQQAFTDFAGQSAIASQIGGRENYSNYQRALQNRLSEIGEEFGKSRNEIGRNRSELEREKSELIGKRPQLYKETLLGLRGESQQTYQANKALGIKEAEFKGARSKIKQELKAKLATIKAEEKKTLAYVEANSNSQKAINREKQKFRKYEKALEAEAAAATRRFREQEEAGQSGREGEARNFRQRELENPAVTGAGNKKSKEPGAWRSQQEANRYIQSIGISPKELYTGGKLSSGQKVSAKEVQHKVFIQLTQNGISAKAAKAAIRKYMGNYSKKLAQDPNGKSLGR